MNLVYSAYPLQREPQFFTDHLSRVFPPFARCKIEEHVLINNARVDELGCHLLLMDIYDKMFVLIWLWLMILILSTMTTVIALLLWVMPPFNRLFLAIQTDSKFVKKIRNKIVKKYSFSDLYVMYLMKRHRSEAQFIIVMSKLIHSEESNEMSLELEKKKSKISFKDEITSNTDPMIELSPSSGKEEWCTKNRPDYSPIYPLSEAVCSRRINSSTPRPNCDDVSFPRHFMNHEYQV